MTIIVANYVPEHLRPGLARYLEEGIRPGSFLSAVLENDLLGAVMYADDVSRAAIPNVVRYLANHAPASAWGSPMAVSQWIKEMRKQ